MNGNFRDAMVSAPQPRNRLEDRRGKDNKMSGGVWKTVKANSRKIRVAETERRRGKGRSGKEMRKTRKKEEAKKKENGRGKKSSRRIGNMEQRERGSKIKGGSRKIGFRKVPPVD